MNRESILHVVVSHRRYPDLMRALEILREKHPRATTDQLIDLIFEIGINTILHHEETAELPNYSPFS